MGDGFMRWVEYYWSTETFDRSLPSARIDERTGDAYPVSEYDRRLSHAHSRNEMRRLHLRGDEPGKMAACVLSFEGLAAALDRSPRFPGGGS